MTRERAVQLARRAALPASVGALVLLFFWPLVFGRSHLVPFHVMAGDPFVEGLDFQADRPDWRVYDMAPVTTFYAEKALCASSLRTGELPLWNPYNGLGFPLLADGQSQPLSPFFWPFMALPTPWVYSWCLVLHLVFGAFGMDRLLRRLGVSRVVRLVGALAFAFNPYTLKYLAYSNVWAYAWLPWLFLCAEKMAATGRGAGAFALCIAFASASGHFEEAFWAAAWAFVYYLLRAQHEGGLRSWFTPKSLIPVVGALLLSAWWVLPFLEWVFHSWSERMEVFRTVPYPLAAPFLRGSELLWPPLLLALALAGAAVRSVARAVAPALAWAFLLLMPFPGWVQVPLSLGFMSSRYARSVGWFALLLLASLGLQRWLDSGIGARLRVTGAALQVAWMGIACAVLLAPGLLALGRQGDQIPLTGASVASSPILWFLWASGLVLWSIGPAWRVIRRPLLLAGLSACLLTWVFMSPPGTWASWNASRPRPSPEVAREAARASGRQWFPVRGAFMCLSPNLSAAFGVRDLRYVQPLTPRNLVPLAGRLGFGFQGFREITPEIAAFSGVQTIWMPPEAGTSTPRHVRMENSQLPRGFWVPEARVAGSAAEAMRLSLEKGAWRETVVLLKDEAPPGLPTGRQAVDGIGSSQLVLDTCNRSAWKVQTPAAGWFVLRDLAWSGWRARMDGQPARLYQADGVFRAVRVEKGGHLIEFLYRPISWVIGVLTSSASLVLMAFLAVRRRNAQPVFSGRTENRPSAGEPFRER